MLKAIDLSLVGFADDFLKFSSALLSVVSYLRTLGKEYYGIGFNFS
jgi:hypothetical protein